jgi:hypothetical protein
MKHSISKNRAAFSIMLILALILSVPPGCKDDTGSDPQDNISADMYTTATNVYKVKTLDFPDKFTNRYSYVDGDKIYCSGWVEMVGSAFAVYGLDGEFIETVFYKRPPDTSYTAIKQLPDGGHIGIEGGTGKSTFYRIDKDGGITAQVTVESQYQMNLIAGKDGLYYYLSSNVIIIYDENLSEIKSIETDITTFAADSLAWDSGGNLLLHDPNYNYYTVDTDTETVKEYDKPQVPESVGKETELYIGSGYDIYYKDIVGIYGCNSGGTEPVLLLDWQNTGLSAGQTTVMQVIDSDTFVAEIADYISGTKNIAVLTRIPDSEVKPKVVLNLLMISRSGSAFIYETVAYFNQTDDTYRIQITDYNLLDSAPDYNQGAQQFNKDITMGARYDIYMLGDYINKSMSSYISKGLFADLTPYIGDNLLKCVSGAYGTDGAVYRIPVYANINTLAAKTSLVGEKQSLTREKLYSIAGSLGTGEALFSSSVGGEISSITQFDFVDFERKTCSFDGSDYLEYLDFISKIGDYTDENKGALVYYDENYYFNIKSPNEALADGSHKFMKAPICTVDSYATIKLCFGNEPFTLCGYPTNSGSGSSMYSRFTVSVDEDSQLKNGAARYLQYLLSDRIQTSNLLTSENMPVTRTAVEMLLECSYYYFDPTLMNPIQGNPLFPDAVSAGFFIKLNEKPDAEAAEMFGNFIEIELTANDKAALLAFLDSTQMKGESDEIITGIIDEELSYYHDGVRSAAEAAKYIQNRVNTYINE